MADEAPQQQEAPVTEPQESAPVGTDDTVRQVVDRTVPYQRFAEVTKQNKQLKSDYELIRSRVEEIESKDQSELQKERRKREQFEQERNELATRVMRVERQAWLRDAARDVKFDDPDDATAFIDVTEVEDFDDAMQAVKALAKRKPKLLRQDPTPDIAQVVKNGQRVQQGQPQQGQQPVQPAGLDPQAQEFLSQLEGAKLASGWQSLPLE